MQFEKWLQRQLTAHGFPVGIDGVMGGETRLAMVAFQKKMNLPESGVADQATVDALRKDPGRPIGGPVPAPVEKMPPWMAEMHRRIGLHEGRDNAVLTAWLKIGSFLGNPAKNPWCGDGVETSVVKTLPYEPVPNNPFFAQNWQTFGINAQGPKVGAIGVIRWNPSSGHVGFVAGYDAVRRRVSLLGANQSNSITITSFSIDDFIAFRWPKTFPMQTYPALSVSGSAGTAAGTR